MASGVSVTLGVIDLLGVVDGVSDGDANGV